LSDYFDEREDGPLKERRRKERAKNEEERLAEAHAQVMATAAGRLAFWSHLQALGVFEDGFALDPRLTDYNLGQRRAALSILAYLRKVCPEHTATMLREHMR
jgi:hypothetical protein